MRRIPLRGRGGGIRAYALVDDEDYERVAAHRWSLQGTGYAHRKVGPKGAQTAILLHRFILGLEKGDGLHTDHRNGDRLDCQRANLRIVTNAQNHQNRTVGKANRSGHLGVSWFPLARTPGRWRAAVVLDGKQHHLGLFDDVDDAAQAVADFRAEHMTHSDRTLRK